MTSRILSILLLSSVIAFAAVDARCASPVLKHDAVESLTLTDDEVRTQVGAYLSSIDTPIGVSYWKALGPRAVPILQEIVADKENFPTQRAKAIDALSILNGPGSATVFREAAQDDSEPFVVRFAAMRSLAAGVEPKSSRNELADLLSNAGDARIRAAAGEAMARADAGSACALVQSQVSRESADTQRYFQRALRFCGSH